VPHCVDPDGQTQREEEAAGASAVETAHFETLALTLAAPPGRHRLNAVAGAAGRWLAVTGEAWWRLAARTSAPGASSTLSAAPSSATTAECAPAHPTRRCEGARRRMLGI
jgi:hypothetical protein